MNALCCLCLNSFILCNFLPKFKLQLYGISVQVPNRFVHDFVAERFISSRAHPNGIFASARESRVLVMEQEEVKQGLFYRDGLC